MGVAPEHLEQVVGAFDSAVGGPVAVGQARISSDQAMMVSTMLFLDFLDSVRGRARVGSSSLPGPALVLVRARRVFTAIVQPMNHTDVVSVQDFEALISEARHLASEEDAGTVHADLEVTWPGRQDREARQRDHRTA